jgi:NADPH-dependent 2,4-dienoyl-CoA reductase/sulfur reductase-like enzyme
LVIAGVARCIALRLQSTRWNETRRWAARPHRAGRLFWNNEINFAIPELNRNPSRSQNDPRACAAGDIAIAPNRWSGQRIRLESWQHAQDQAIAAAKAALGREVRYDPLPFFWSDQYAINLQIYGLPAPSCGAVIRVDAGSSSFLLFYLQDDRVKAVGANAPPRAALLLGA